MGTPELVPKLLISWWQLLMSCGFVTQLNSVFTNVRKGMCVCTHTHIENRGHCLESSLIAFHLFFRLSLIEPRLHRLGWTGWPASLGILLTIALGVTGLHGCGQIFHKCSREWNSGPQTCTANIFLTGLSSRSFHGFRNTVSSFPKMLSTHPWRETYHSTFWGGTAHTGSPSSPGRWVYRHQTPCVYLPGCIAPAHAHWASLATWLPKARHLQLPTGQPFLYPQSILSILQPGVAISFCGHQVGKQRDLGTPQSVSPAS